MPPGPIAAIAWRACSLWSPSGAAGSTTWTASSKATTPSVSPGPSRSTSAMQRAPRGLQPLAGHRAAAVEHDLHGDREPLGPGVLGRLELQQHGQLVLLLHGHQLDVQLRVHVHSSLLARVVLEGGSSPAGGI